MLLFMLPQLSFLVDVRALSLSTYTFRDNDQIRKASLASTSVRDGKDVEHDETGTSNETYVNLYTDMRRLTMSVTLIK